MPRGSKALLIWPEFGPQPRALFLKKSILFSSSLHVPVSWAEMWNKITVWPSPGWIYCLGPKKGAALIVICAIFQTVLMIGLWRPLIAKIASPQLVWDLPCWGKLRKYNTFPKAIKMFGSNYLFFLFASRHPSLQPLNHGFTYACLSRHQSWTEIGARLPNIWIYLFSRFSEGKCVAVDVFDS